MATPAEGHITQIIGAVIDVEFPRESIPHVYEALKLKDVDLTLEVQQQLGDGVVRTIAMGSSEGLKRGLARAGDRRADLGTGGRGHARAHHGRPRPPAGQPGPGEGERVPADPPPAAVVRRAGRRPGPAGHGHQGHRPSGAVRQGRQGGTVRRRGRGQDRQHARADQQHRQAVLGPLGVRRRRRAYPRGQRLLSRDDRVGRHRQGQPRRTRRWRWSTDR